MNRYMKICIAALLFCGIWAGAADDSKAPHIGYLYPAGARQGETIKIFAGGQFLRGPSNVYITGEGIEAKVVTFMRPTFNLDADQRQELRRRFKETREKRLDELTEADRPADAVPRKPAKSDADKSRPGNNTKEQAAVDEVKLPDHPLWYNVEDQSLRELAHTVYMLSNFRQKQQPNRQLAETVLIEITVAPNARPGARELRIETAAGLTNPVVFQVGTLPEVRELEPNSGQGNIGGMLPMPRPAKDKPFYLPVIINGQIMPGDIDRFDFTAAEGQKLVIDVQARSLIPYLADAVPGWFQATLALYDAKGSELAFTDDYRFNPDPVLFFEVPRDGDYTLEIRDSIYRGREDFVYRISIGEQPFITQTFPLGAKQGTKASAGIAGWNLKQKRLALDTASSQRCVYRTGLYADNVVSNEIVYAVDTLRECVESEPNDTIKTAQELTLPVIVNGRIASEKDVDVFTFEGRKGQKIIAEVQARELNSPLDSLVRITDASGKVIAWNDDFVLKGTDFLYKDAIGIITHHADSYVTAELPEAGRYYVHLCDSQRQGGKAFAYRLRVSGPRPDFALRVTPSSLTLRQGETIPLCVHVLRKDGFDGEIELKLKDPPAGFRLEGARIPAGADRICVTLTAPAKSPPKPVTLELEGLSRLGKQQIVRPAVPAEDVMQAFLYRHLVPSQQLVACVKKSRIPTPGFAYLAATPVKLLTGQSDMVKVKAPKRPILDQVRLELHNPPAGVTLGEVSVVPTGLAFRLNVDKETVKQPLCDNLIIEAYTEVTPPAKEGKPPAAPQRFSLGYFPAMPVEIGVQ